MNTDASSRNSGYLLIFVLAITSTLAPLSVDFFAPSMPGASLDLATSTTAVQSTLYIFFIGYAVSPFLWGGLADKFGRRRVMLAGVLCYCFASFGCFMAPGIFELSVFRLLQGVGAASGVVIARAVLRDIHGPAGATKAMSGMVLIMVWIPILAPVLGGYLATDFGWRASFFVMTLVAGLSLLGCYFWLAETLPDKSPILSRARNNWTEILINPVFIGNALANMFCIGTMLLFISNYSFLSEQHFQLSAAQNGYVLSTFNTGISVGVYLVRFFAPRLGVKKTVSVGLWVALAGWASLWGLCFGTVPEPVFMLAPILLACLGTGMVISLTVGEALVPFAYVAGAASALFVFVQSAGSSLISFFVSFLSDNSLGVVTTALVLCSMLAMASMKLIQPKAKT